jgi:hypothetical protein
MKTSLLRFSILALSAAVAIGSTTAQAALVRDLQDTPMLVDKYGHIKDPSGPVGPPVELKEGYVLKVQPSGDPMEGVPQPDPRSNGILIGL